LDKTTFDAIVTDFSLPGMSGDELAVRALKQQPGLGVVVASGYETLPSTANRPELRHAVALRKPYNEAALAGALRSALTPPDGARGEDLASSEPTLTDRV
jgi:DNA-binding NtrC family response regulator